MGITCTLIQKSHISANISSTVRCNFKMQQGKQIPVHAKNLLTRTGWRCNVKSDRPTSGHHIDKHDGSLQHYLQFIINITWYEFGITNNNSYFSQQDMKKWKNLLAHFTSLILWNFNSEKKEDKNYLPYLKRFCYIQTSLKINYDD